MNKERPDLIHNVTALPDKPHAPSLKQDLTIMAALPNCPACLAQDAGIYLAHVTEDAADVLPLLPLSLRTYVGCSQGRRVMPHHASEVKSLSRIRWE